MEQLILDTLGPVAPWLTTLSVGAVVAMRKRIRRPHILALVLITVLAFLGFLALILVALAGGLKLPAFVFTAGPPVLAGLMAVCGPAVGFWLILRQLGFVPDETAVMLPRSGLRRQRR